jgi:hypothetical protein
MRGILGVERFVLLGKQLTAVVLAALLPNFALAKPLIFTCSMSIPKGEMGVPPEIVFAQEGDKITVYDPFIRHFMGEPITGKPAVNTSDRLTVKWQLKRIKKVEPYIPTIDYTAQLQLIDNTVSIRVVPRGDYVEFWAQGKCSRK